MIYSFIIPMYNEIKDIKRTVENCLQQDEGDFSWEIILIDDGSEDDTYQLCMNEYGKNKLIRLYKNKQNMGVSSSRNIGVGMSIGDVLIFLNADELVKSDFLKRIDAHYKAGADYVFPQTRVENNTSGYGCFRDSYRLQKYNRPSLFMWSQGFSCRKSLFEKAGGFDSRYPGCGGEDWDFVSKLDQLAANRVVDLNIVVSHMAPNKTRQILWHMYNRGRGTSNYDLIYLGLNPFNYVSVGIIRLIIIMFLFVLDYWIVVTVGTYQLCKMLFQGWHLYNSYEKRNPSIIGYFILDKLIRKIGYFINVLRNLLQALGM